ncbi:murein biosynthesis integral membrane protein MurJ [Campylobacter ureolyticus]|uniref:murein biosynthesis integral membrane protein MurJ n=1 Tax=Campylobacter ureolyticus TaxID=827 RepID=UPI0022B42031|nr:murein biosynthesis integral membrane protein MurJ [Campylobacter ureolyticus]MCZ6155436.1 murein biosynthesis integral membrane protein MurJ [Campylobacter ureolyticus]MDU7070284.1 murein biosynthesis integral membrane protein MurJ [Campylobacter ureolyticus]
MAKKRVFAGFFTNSIGIFVSRILGLFRDLLTASVLGAGVWSDIFFIAFKLPNLFRRLFGEGAFTQAFLPGFAQAKKKAIFATTVLIKFTVFILFLTLLVNVFAPLFTKFLAIGFNKQTINLAVPYVRINFWYLTFIFLVTLFASLLQYKDHFATTAFSTALLNISMIISLVLAKGKDDETIVLYLSVGVVIGGIMQLLVHLFALKKLKLLRYFGVGITALKKGKKADTKGFYKNFFHGVIGSSAAQIGAFIDTWFASFLAFGSISYLYYANRIFQLPLALFAIALSTALFPKIAKTISKNDDKTALILLSKAFHLLFALLLFSTIGGVILSKEIIWLLFERGAFTRSDTVNSMFVLSMFMIGLLPFGLAKIFSLWLYAKNKQNIAAKIAIKSLILNIISCFLLIKPLGAAGLALASSIGGFYLFIMNLKEFGFRNFLDIINPKKIFIILALCSIEVLLLLVFKEIINDYI